MTLQEIVVGGAIAVLLIYVYLWFVNRPVLLFIPTELAVTQYNDASRVVSRKQIVMSNGGVDLKVGSNEFYLLVRDGSCTWHTLSSKAIANPNLRGAEDVVLLRLTLLVERLRVTKFKCTNLSDLDVQLIWGTEKG